MLMALPVLLYCGMDSCLFKLMVKLSIQKKFFWKQRLVREEWVGTSVVLLQDHYGLSGCLLIASSS